MMPQPMHPAASRSRPCIGLSWRGILSFMPLVLAVLIAPPHTFAQIEAEEAEAVNETQISVVGLRVIGQAHGGMRPFSWPPGTTISVQVEPPGGNLVALDINASTLNSFTDDRGTNLLGGGLGILWSSPAISSNRRVIVLELVGKRPATADAAAIHARGEFVLKTASEKKSYRQKSVALKKGTKIDAGPITFTITKAGKPRFGSKPLEVEMKAERGDLYPLVEIRFFDDGGKEIEASIFGNPRFGLPRRGEKNIDRTLHLARKVQTATVELVYWSDMRTHRVPFDIEASVGVETNKENQPEDEHRPPIIPDDKAEPLS